MVNQQDKISYRYREESLLVDVVSDMGPEGLVYSLPVKNIILCTQSQEVWTIVGTSLTKVQIIHTEHQED